MPSRGPRVCGSSLSFLGEGGCEGIPALQPSTGMVPRRAAGEHPAAVTAPRQGGVQRAAFRCSTSTSAAAAGGGVAPAKPRCLLNFPGHTCTALHRTALHCIAPHDNVSIRICDTTNVFLQTTFLGDTRETLQLTLKKQKMVSDVQGKDVYRSQVEVLSHSFPTWWPQNTC